MTYTTERVGIPPDQTESEAAKCAQCQAHFWYGVIVTTLVTAAAVFVYTMAWKRAFDL